MGTSAILLGGTHSNTSCHRKRVYLTLLRFFGVLFVCFIIKQGIQLLNPGQKRKRLGRAEGKNSEISAFFLSFSPPPFFV